MVWTEQEEIILFPQEEPQQPQWGYLDPYHLHQWRKSRHPGIVQRLGSGMCPILAPLSDLPLLPHMAHPPLKPLCWPGKVSENLPAHGPYWLGRAGMHLYAGLPNSQVSTKGTIGLHPNQIWFDPKL